MSLLATRDDIKAQASWLRNRIAELIDQGYNKQQIINTITSELGPRFPTLSEDQVRKYAQSMVEKKFQDSLGEREVSRAVMRDRKVREIKGSSNLFCQQCGKRLKEVQHKLMDGSTTYTFYCPQHGTVKDLSATEGDLARMKFELKGMIKEAKKEIKERPKGDFGEYASKDKKIGKELELERLRKEREKESRRETRELSWQRKGVSWIEDKGGKYFVKGLTLVFFTGIGVALSAALGLSWHFILAFISLGLFFFFPSPDDIEIPKEVKKLSPDNPLTWKILGKMDYYKGSHNVFAYFRSVFKIAVFVFFIWGVNVNPFPLSNIILIILSFIGYYSLKIKYDVNKPHQLIESVIRFGFLGLYFIPWVIMYGVFDSMLLAFIAMAFFAIPPVAEDKKSSEITAMYDMYDKILFGAIMLGVLAGFIAGWDVELSSTMGITFLYFWFVSGISGFFSPPEARPAMGFIMLGGATIIYGIGPGTQEVMSGLFGPWWPTIQNTFSSITEPLGETFGGLSNTLQGGWLLLTNPVGYATQLMNGTHAQNPQGSTGALGVEITDVTISPIFPEQPFVITALIENKGALDAEDVIMYLSTGYEAPKKVGPSKWWGPLNINIYTFYTRSKYFRDIMTFADMFGMNDSKRVKELIKCPDDEDYDPATGMACKYVLERQNIWQQVFTSSNGVSCNTIEEYNLREKYIPIKVSVTYNYTSDSEVEIEFINNNEWQRLAESGQLGQNLRMIQSQYSTAPVEFPIGTPGMKNPILVDQPFHVGMRIEPSSARGSIDDLERVVLEYPEEFVLSDDCSPDESTPVMSSRNGYKRIEWRDLSEGPKVFFCPFEKLGSDKLTGPTKTYIIRAHANYTFTRWKEKDTKIEFGGKCCGDDDCIADQICTQEGMCIAEGSASPEDLCPGICSRLPTTGDELDSIVTRVAGSNGIDKDLIVAIMNRETNSNHCEGLFVRKGDSGELGIMQLMPGTAKDMGVDPCNLEDNINGGAKYLSQMINKYSEHKDSIRLGILAYNWGPGRVDSARNNCGPSWEDIKSQSCREKGLRPVDEVIGYVNEVCGEYGKCN